MTDFADPHANLQGCFRYIPPLVVGQTAHPIGAQFTCPECGRVYTREKVAGVGLPMWRAAPHRQRPTSPASRTQ